MASRIALAVILVTSISLGATAAAQLVARGGTPLQATLTGPEEIPPGDPDGTGTMKLTVNPGQRRVCYTLSVENIATPTAAHIHVGAAGTAPPGNIVIPLDTPADGDVEACEENVSRDLLVQIIQKPADYYVNVHNADFPAGAVRGQLQRAPGSEKPAS